MLSVLLKHGLGINNYIKSNFNTLKEDYISPQDWKLLCTTYITDALSTMLQLLGEESQEASWLI